MSENSNEIEFEDLMNKGTSEFSYADIQWLKGYAHTFYLQLENIKKEYDKALQQKENIIKEVREYVENNKQYAELEDYGKNGEYYIDEIGLLEILDKAGSDKE